MVSQKAAPYVVEMKGITKRFPGTLANDRIDFRVKQGEIHGLLGENGAGKTTLMNILYGLLKPDEGEIFVKGQKVEMKSPKNALEMGIGMVHQHFTLVDPFTVTENIIIGLRSPREPFLNLEAAARKVEELSAKYGLKVDPRARIWQLSVGERQRVEILKILYRGVKVLILDEPTSVLTPQEAQELFATLKSMAKEGHAVIFISHKLEEVMSATSNVTVLRAGRVVSTVETSKTSKEELAKMMVGREVLFRLEKAAVKTGEVILRVENLHALRDNGLPALKGVSFSVREGEILGIAGVAGNGQSELAEVITGLRRATDGRVYISGKNATNLSSKEIIEHGVGHIPEDRINQGLIMDFTVTESAILDTHHMAPFSRGALLNFSEINSHVEALIKNFDVRCPSEKVLTKQLSGGNLQKLILAREISRDPKLLVAVNATTGLDVGATEYVHKKLEEQREHGKSILLISEDLDELIKLCDRLAVMYEGRIVGMLSAKEIDIDKIGLMMMGAKRAE